MIAITPDIARLVLNQLDEGNACYACEFYVQIAWPYVVTHDGRRYRRTGKEGTRRRDGMPSAEYQAENQRRIWLGFDGVVAED